MHGWFDPLYGIVAQIRFTVFEIPWDFYMK
jgi:hypothetical protein